ncbi:MAG: hypothetical protein ABJD11_02405 [Gemmatimonadota bacterium]
MARVRLWIVLAVLLVPCLLEAQIPPHRNVAHSASAPTLLVATPFAEGAALAGVEPVGNAMRSRLGILARGKYEVIAKETIWSALKSFGYQPASPLSEATVTALAAQFHASLFVFASMDTDGGKYRVQAKVGNLVVNVRQADNQSLESLGTSVADQLRAAVQ